MPITVDAIDSVPVFTAGENSLAYDFGADNGVGKSLSVKVGGAAVELVPGLETTIAGEHGRLTLGADGSCHYAPNSDWAAEDVFEFTIKDADGDIAIATLAASLVDGAPQMHIDVQDADSLAAISLMGVDGE